MGVKNSHSTAAGCHSIPLSGSTLPLPHKIKNCRAGRSPAALSWDPLRRRDRGRVTPQQARRWLGWLEPNLLPPETSTAGPAAVCTHTRAVLPFIQAVLGNTRACDQCRNYESFLGKNYTYVSRALTRFAFCMYEFF